ncbi:ZIP family metal transporter [Sutcliffiella cohnii]
MLQALFWGGLAGLALIIGAVFALLFSIPRKLTGYIMAFGTGILIGAAAFELLGKVNDDKGYVYVILGFIIGATVFTISEYYISKKGGHHRKRSKENKQNNSGKAIFIGTIIDAIPESMIIGVGILKEHTVSWVIVLAIFISNFPEALSSTVGLKKEGYSKKKIITMWSIVMLLSSLSSFSGYVIFKELSEQYVAFISGIAAGGIITMVSSTMLPEAYEEGGPIVGFVSALGLLCSYVLSFIVH